MDDSVIICDEIIESYNEDAGAEVKSDDEAKLYDETNLALLIAVSIYCYLIKHQAKQLLPFHYTNKELRKVLY